MLQAKQICCDLYTFLRLTMNMSKRVNGTIRIMDVVSVKPPNLNDPPINHPTRMLATIAAENNVTLTVTVTVKPSGYILTQRNRNVWP